jgi:iron(III) transport system ATP-binding protein
MTQLTVTSVHKAFGTRPVLTDVDLEVPEGSLTAILGPSGSGKTTLLRIIAGFEEPDSGSVCIGPVMVDGPGLHLPSERRRIGYVPQEGALFPHLTVAANIGFGLPRPERRGHRVTELLDAVGLGGLGGRYPHQLSGGQQQRVALARALAIKPRLVLLDEPFAALDAHLRATIRAEVRQLLRQAGATAVLVTHDQDEALSTADRVAVLRAGQVAQCAAPHDLYSRPADPELASFIGEANLVDGVLADGSVDTALGRLTVQPGARAALRPGPVTVLVRPEQLELCPAGDTGKSCLAGQVIAYGYHGHDAVIQVQPERAAGLPTIVVRTADGHDMHPGSQVTIRARGPVLAYPRGARLADWSDGRSRTPQPRSGLAETRATA